MEAHTQVNSFLDAHQQLSPSKSLPHQSELAEQERPAHSLTVNHRQGSLKLTYGRT